MERRVLDFAALLRRNGIRVSTAETLDALRAAELSGLRDRTLFKSALRATMVKRAPDVPAFDSLFDLFFSGVGDMIEEVGAESAAGVSGGRGFAPRDPRRPALLSGVLSFVQQLL